MKWTNPLLPVLTAGLVCLLAGCGDRNPGTAKQNTKTDPTAGTAQVALTKAKVGDVTDYIKSQQGKVVVVDLWNVL